MARRDALLRLTSRLVVRRDALRETLRDDLDGFRTVSGMSGVGDNVDAAVDAANDEICSQLVELESRELGQIEQALHRITTGTYGRCASCGRGISAARLNVLPYTDRCIDCQRENERQGHSRAPEPDPERWSRVDEESIDEGASDVPINFGDFEMDFGACGRRPLDSLLVSLSSRRR
jgi:DnaK suppressor protein